MSDMDLVFGSSESPKMFEAVAEYSFGYPADSQWNIRVLYPRIVFVRFDGKTIGSATVAHNPNKKGCRSQDFVFNLVLQHDDPARLDIEQGMLCIKPQFSLVASMPYFANNDAVTQQVLCAGMTEGVAVYEMVGAIDLVRDSDPQADGRVLKRD